MNLELEAEQKLASQKLAKMVYSTFCTEQSDKYCNVMVENNLIEKSDDEIETLVSVLQALPDKTLMLPHRDLAEIIDLEYSELLLQEFGLALAWDMRSSDFDDYEIADYNLRNWFCNCETLENELRNL